MTIGDFNGVYGYNSSAVKRKCFISYYSGDRVAVDKFLEDFGHIFIAKAVGVSDGDDFIESDDSDYVMSKIREKYLGDSTVTICLIGDCTHSRRYIDWELKTTLRQGQYYIPNGLIAILLPYKGDAGHLPDRIKDNYVHEKTDQSYVSYHSYPKSTSVLSSWIENAFESRTAKAHLIKNSSDRMKNNHKCLMHKVTH